MDVAASNSKDIATASSSTSGREGIRGWLNPTRYGWERVSYWLQRLTGLGLLIYFIGHVYETSSLTNGINAWNSMLQLTQTLGGHLFLLFVIGASTFHTVNGIRLIFTESGKGIGKTWETRLSISCRIFKL